MARRKSRGMPAPGDWINVRFGDRVVPAVVTRVSGDRIHIELTIEGADEPIASLLRSGQLVSA